MWSLDFAPVAKPVQSFGDVPCAIMEQLAKYGIGFGPLPATAKITKALAKDFRRFFDSHDWDLNYYRFDSLKEYMSEHRRYEERARRYASPQPFDAQHHQIKEDTLYAVDILTTKDNNNILVLHCEFRTDNAFRSFDFTWLQSWNYRRQLG